MISKRNYFVTVDKNEEEEKQVFVTEVASNHYKVCVNDVEHEVDFAVTGDDYYSIIIDGKSYDIDISESGDNFEVLLEGDHYDIEVLDEMKRLMKLRHTAGLEGRQVIESQMAGYIWKILVEEGQEVEAGEPLMILVAMKMENEIKAPKAGVVEELFIELDQTVVAGDRLAVVE